MTTKQEISYESRPVPQIIVRKGSDAQSIKEIRTQGLPAPIASFDALSSAEESDSEEDDNRRQAKARGKSKQANEKGNGAAIFFSKILTDENNKNDDALLQSFFSSQDGATSTTLTTKADAHLVTTAASVGSASEASVLTDPSIMTVSSSASIVAGREPQQEFARAAVAPATALVEGTQHARIPRALVSGSDVSAEAVMDSKAGVGDNNANNDYAATAVAEAIETTSALRQRTDMEDTTYDVNYSEDANYECYEDNNVACDFNTNHVIDTSERINDDNANDKYSEIGPTLEIGDNLTTATEAGDENDIIADDDCVSSEANASNAGSKIKIVLHGEEFERPRSPRKFQQTTEGDVNFNKTSKGPPSRPPPPKAVPVKESWETFDSSTKKAPPPKRPPPPTARSASKQSSTEQG